MRKENLTAEEKYNNLVEIIRRAYDDSKLVYNTAYKAIGSESSIAQAKKGALMVLQEIMQEAGIERAKSKFYFTFGTSAKYPYTRGQYIVVMADSYREAAGKFKAKYPNPDSDELINCADYYSEKEWEKYAGEYYAGKMPEEIIA